VFCAREGDSPLLASSKPPPGGGQRGANGATQALVGIRPVGGLAIWLTGEGVCQPAGGSVRAGRLPHKYSRAGRADLWRPVSRVDASIRKN
jgi:hypothetical protein